MSVVLCSAILKASILDVQSGFEAWLQRSEDEMPRALYEAMDCENNGYAEANASYNSQQWGAAKMLISDLQPGLKHHDIHCISFTPSFKLICGFTLNEFGRLLLSLQPELKTAFPRCPIMLGPEEISSKGSIRLKLFLCLYRIKLGTTFREMECTFGWCKTSIHEWFETVLYVLHVKLRRYHHGFLDFKGKNWQMQQVCAWVAKHNTDGNCWLV